MISQCNWLRCEVMCWWWWWWCWQLAIDHVLIRSWKIVWHIVTHISFRFKLNDIGKCNRIYFGMRMKAICYCAHYSCLLMSCVSKCDVQRVSHDSTLNTRTPTRTHSESEEAHVHFELYERCVKWWETWFQLFRRDIKSLGSLLWRLYFMWIFSRHSSLSLAHTIAHTLKARTRGSDNDNRRNEIKSELHWPR